MLEGAADRYMYVKGWMIVWPQFCSVRKKMMMMFGVWPPTLGNDRCVSSEKRCRVRPAVCLRAFLFFFIYFGGLLLQGGRVCETENEKER